ncbi:hypothetical protein [Sphingomicrobium flavum]|uniref:hypothetical protein n=1 Tax=Sphingomicrobium flavum TaxID=1229164 RepID=UPI0021AD72C9|nr:hypothetical protein [Sphingomicrobium flavum]
MFPQFQPVDYGSPMRSAAALIPDYAADEANSRLLSIQQQNADTSRMQEQRHADAQRRAVDREEGFSDAFLAWQDDPSHDGIVRLMGAYPEYFDKAQKAFEMEDEQTRRETQTSLSQTFSALANGRPDLAKERIWERRQADAAAGLGTDDEDALLALLESDNPLDMQRARSSIALELALQLGEQHFSSGFSRLLESVETPGYEEFAQRMGYEEGSPEYQRAMLDFVLKGSGPSAFDEREALEEQRQANRQSLINQREQVRRDRPRQTNVVERIREKIAAGKPLTEGEQRIWDRTGGSKVKPKPTAPAPKDGTIIRNPTTGERRILRGGKWVSMKED